jgi:hypothetical protein
VSANTDIRERMYSPFIVVADRNASNQLLQTEI